MLTKLIFGNASRRMLSTRSLFTSSAHVRSKHAMSALNLGTSRLAQRRTFSDHPAVEIPEENVVLHMNDEGDLIGTVEGEEVIFPELVATLEWALSTPVEMHLFEELPLIKEVEGETDDD